MMNKKEKQIRDAHAKNRRMIGRLWNTFTPVKEILELNRLNDIALQNDLAKLEAEQ
jgi:hypothetical protein